MLYRVNHKSCTIHYCWTHDVARSVGADLVDRYQGISEIEGPLHPEYRIDFGGMILSSDVAIKYQKDGFSLSFWEHHHQKALAKVDLALSNVRKGDYIKIHGIWSSISLPLSFAKDFRQWVVDNRAEFKEY